MQPARLSTAIRIKPPVLQFKEDESAAAGRSGVAALLLRFLARPHLLTCQSVASFEQPGSFLDDGGDGDCVLPESDSPRVGLEMVESLFEGHREAHRSPGDVASHIADLVGPRVPIFEPFVNVIEVVPKVRVAQWRIVANTEKVTRAAGFFFSAAASPEDLRENGGRHQDCLQVHPNLATAIGLSRSRSDSFLR